MSSSRQNRQKEILRLQRHRGTSLMLVFLTIINIVDDNWEVTKASGLSNQPELRLSH